MTARELGAVLSQVLLAACGSSSSPQPPQPPSNTVGSGSDATAPKPPPPPAACKHGEVTITGCGGAEVALPDGTAACNLPGSGDEREGVVGETWGALVARHQAAHAADADVRDAMARIADDETAHAALSFAIASWARGALPAAELDEARATALAALRDSAARPAPDAAARLGWPSPAIADALLARLEPALAPA